MALTLIAENRSDGTVLRHVVPDEGAANIGRSSSSDLVLPTSNVSKHHARLLARDRRTIITDLKSTNGTFINGRMIEQATIVRDQDTVQIGEWHLRCEWSADNVNPRKKTITAPMPAVVPNNASEEATLNHALPFTARHPREKDLIEAIVATPSDDSLRQVYGDWLEEHGYPLEAELLSLEREIRRDGGDSIDPHELGRLGYRLRTVADSLPIGWRVLVVRSPIESCNDTRFETTCPRTWDRLTPTANAFVRSCGSCGKNVYFATTMAQARGHIKLHRPVVVNGAIERYARDVDAHGPVVLDVSPPGVERRTPVPAPGPAAPEAPPPQQASIVTALPFFARPEPPKTVGDLMAGLQLTPPDPLPEHGRMGSLLLPMDAPGAPDVGLSPFILRVWILYHWDVHHESPRAQFDDISWKGYRSFTIHFSSDGNAIDAWLAVRQGAAREAVCKTTYTTTHYRVYGKWLISLRPDGSGLLEWYDELPEWALPTMDTNAAFAFLSELVDAMKREASYDEIKELAGRPPARSGILVTGPLNKGDFWLGFEPKLSALEIARVFGLGDQPVGTSGDVHMSSWSLASLAPGQTGRAQPPAFGSWTVNVGLDGWPSGENIPDHYACKRIGPDDRVRVLSLCRSL